MTEVVLKTGDPVWVIRGGERAKGPGRFRRVKATYIGERGNDVCCSLDQDDPDDTVGWSKIDSVGWWGKSAVIKRKIKHR